MEKPMHAPFHCLFQLVPLFFSPMLLHVSPTVETKQTIKFNDTNNPSTSNNHHK